MQADPTITTYLPIVALMDQVETTKVLWALTIVIIVLLFRIYFLNARVRKLEGSEPEPTVTGWIRPTRSLIKSMSTRSIRAVIYNKPRYPASALCGIQPWDTQSIVSLSVFMRQAAGVGEIALQRRIATVSAIVHSFAIPSEMMLLDDEAVALYLDYRARVSPALGSVELMQYAHVGDEGEIDQMRLNRLLDLVVPIVGLLLKAAEKEAWPVFDMFYQNLMIEGIAGPIDRHELKSVVTAYSAYSKMLVPSEYVLNSAMAFCIYRRLSTADMYEPYA